MTITKRQIPSEWQRGIERAQSRGLKATLRKGGTFTVPSGSRAGTVYTIHLTEAGKVGPCSCEASHRFGPEFACAHRGAVALAVFFFRSISIEVAA